jgi:alkyldihydroxyacetonephosphate synthase
MSEGYGGPDLSPDLLKALEETVGKKNVSTRNLDRMSYARDIWPKCYFWLRRAETPYVPAAIVWPGSVEEVSRVMKLALEHKVPLTPVGAGSGVCGGAIPVKGGIILDLKRLARLREVNARNLTCEVEAGMIGQPLEDALNRQGLTLGHFPSSMYCSSVGGWIAARSAGQLSSKYGKIEDMVIALEGVLPDGSIFHTRRTPRSAAGPDLNQVIIGSEGTLAVVTAATLSLHRLPELRILRGFLFPDVPSGVSAIRRVMQAGLDPSVVRLYDELDTKVNAEKMGVTRHGCLFVIGFEGPDSNLTRKKAEKGFRICAECGGDDLGEGPGLAWHKHRYSISYKMSEVLSQEGAILDTIEVAAVWSGVTRLYREIREAIIPHALVMAHFSHAYPEGCSIYFTFAAQGAERSEEDIYDTVWDEAMKACIKAGGTFSHHHGVGMHKAKWMALEHGPAHEIYKGLKRYLDPENLLNPGKMGLE